MHLLPLLLTLTPHDGHYHIRLRAGFLWFFSVSIIVFTGECLFADPQDILKALALAGKHNGKGNFAHHRLLDLLGDGRQTVVCPKSLLGRGLDTAGETGYISASKEAFDTLCNPVKDGEGALTLVLLSDSRSSGRSSF